MINLIYIGIDPGKKGGMAVYDDLLNSQDEIQAFVYDYDKYRKVLKDSKLRCVVFIENVHAMPNQGVTSMFNFGQHFGQLLGILDAYEIRYELVNPQKWKKEFSCTSDKNTSIQVAKRLFPNVSLKPTDRCTKDSDGIAEALLIMEYGRRSYEGVKGSI